MKPKVYIETSTISYLVARPSRDLPIKASQDALHIAVATIYGVDYLLTWNCKHIANAVILKKIAKITAEQGYELPTICTPYELMGE